MTEEEFKAAVRRRDGNRCIECGMTNEEHRGEYGKGLHVHRIIPGSDYTLEGCITLCRSCHNGKPGTGAPKRREHGNNIMFRLDDGRSERLDRLAERLGLNRTATLRLLVSEGLDRHLGPEAARPAPA